MEEGRLSSIQVVLLRLAPHANTLSPRPPNCPFPWATLSTCYRRGWLVGIKVGIGFRGIV